jgi:hypothetical protein
MDVWFVRGTSKTVTMTNANPGVVTLVGHGFETGHEIKFTSTGVITGITMGNRYYVIATDLAADTFKFSATSGGLGVDTTGTQSGVHTVTSFTGVPIAGTNTQNMINSTNFQLPVAVPIILPGTPGDFMRLDYSCDDIKIRWLAVAAAASPTRPACPSVILTVTKVSR